MANAVKCGIINLGNGIMPIVCLQETGDLVVIDDLMGRNYISEITVEDPIPFKSDEGILKRLGCRGVVTSGDGLYVFHEDTYQYFALPDLQTPTLESSYDTDAEYEGPDFNW